jgi:hypothetical protein
MSSTAKATEHTSNIWLPIPSSSIPGLFVWSENPQEFSILGDRTNPEKSFCDVSIVLEDLDDTKSLFVTSRVSFVDPKERRWSKFRTYYRRRGVGTRLTVAGDLSAEYLSAMCDGHSLSLPEHLSAVPDAHSLSLPAMPAGTVDDHWILVCDLNPEMAPSVVPSVSEGKSAAEENARGAPEEGKSKSQMATHTHLKDLASGKIGVSPDLRLFGQYTGKEAGREEAEAAMKAVPELLVSEVIDRHKMLAEYVKSQNLVKVPKIEKKESEES